MSVDEITLGRIGATSEIIPQSLWRAKQVGCPALAHRGSGGGHRGRRGDTEDAEKKQLTSEGHRERRGDTEDPEKKQLTSEGHRERRGDTEDPEKKQLTSEGHRERRGVTEGGGERLLCALCVSSVFSVSFSCYYQSLHSIFFLLLSRGIMRLCAFL
jgi:hypothetical protein